MKFKISTSVVGILLLFTLLSIPQPATATDTAYFPQGYDSTYNYSGETPQWETLVKSTWLGWGETTSFGNGIIGNYTLEAYDFQVDSDTREVTGALVILYKSTNSSSGPEVARGFHIDGRTSPYINYRDDVRITLSDVKDAGSGGTEWGSEVKPQVQIKVEGRSTPDPSSTSLKIASDRDITDEINKTFSSTDFWTKYSFKNTGDATLYDTTFTVNTSNFTVLEARDSQSALKPSHYTVDGDEVTINYADVESRVDNSTGDYLASGETYTFRLRLKAPSLINETTYNITSKISGKDLKGRTYSNTSKAPMRVLSKVYVNKDIRPDMNTDTDEREMYLGREFSVIITIRNFADTPVTLTRLTDSMPSSFALLANQTPEWTNVTVDGKSSTTLRYKIMPRGTGEHDIPEPVTNFSWNGKGAASVEVAVDKVTVGTGSVHGPIITMNKTVTPTSLEEDEEGNVTIEISNSGDRAARIVLTDDIPEGISPLDPAPSLSTVLAGGDTVTASYRFRATQGGRNVTFPAATLDYLDVYGTRWTVTTDPTTVHVAPGENTTPTPTATPTDNTTTSTPENNATDTNDTLEAGNSSGNTTGNASSEEGFLGGILPDVSLPELPDFGILDRITGLFGGLLG